MKYYATIYIDILKELRLFSGDFTHAFLGLTHIHPDELDSLGDIEIEKYDIVRYNSCIES